MMPTNQPSEENPPTRVPPRSCGEAAPAPLDLGGLTPPAVPDRRPQAKTSQEFLQLAAVALAELEEDLARGKSDTLIQFLAAMSRFPTYSFSNVMLICLQRPTATHVAGFQTWKRLGRYVKRGEKGIGIIAPMIFAPHDDKQPAGDGREQAPQIRFKVVRVFDVSQTDGQPLPEFAAIGGDPGAYLPRLRDLVTQQGIHLEYAEIPGGAEGVSRGGAITLQPGLAPAKDFAVLVHELAHELLHTGDRRQATTKTQRETEAEAVAFVVSRAVGLDCGTHASDYIQLYQGDATTLTSSLELIQRTAAGILRELVPSVRQQEDA